MRETLIDEDNENLVDFKYGNSIIDARKSEFVQANSVQIDPRIWGYLKDIIKNDFGKNRSV